MRGKLKEILLFDDQYDISYRLSFCNEYAKFTTLSRSYLHDKIGNPKSVGTIIKMLDPTNARQFVAVAYCLSQIAKSKASIDVMMEMECVPVMCGLLNAVSDVKEGMAKNPLLFASQNVTAEDEDSTFSRQLEILKDGVSYLWEILANISIEPSHMASIAGRVQIVRQIQREAEKPLEPPEHSCNDESTSSDEFTDYMSPEILPFLLNFTCIKNLQNLTSADIIIDLCLAVRSIFCKANGPSLHKVRMDTATILVNLACTMRFSRKTILGPDLINNIDNKGQDDTELNMQYIKLVSIISNEENCCIPLMDQGAQKLLVQLLDNKNSLAKDLVASAFHNMSLKRALFVPGQLQTMLEISRGTKSLRLLWVVRALANMSAKNKPRTTLAKERNVIPVLAKLMRGGCDDADRVQRYCAFAICNILSSHVDRGIIDELIKNKTIADIVVVTLLRINSGFTKEALSRALFNFLSRGETREIMIGKGGKDDLDLLGAILELAKIELLDLLAISVRIIYNISCEISNPTYAAKLSALSIPTQLIARVTHNPHVHGAKANNEIKLMSSMAMANMSFDENLARSMAIDRSFPDAAMTIYKLHSDEGLYCINTVIFKISFFEECISMADSPAVTVLVDTLGKNLINCTQLAIGSLCNFSLHEAFYAQLTAAAMKGVVEILSSPQIAMPIKLDCLHFVYNLVTVYPQSRAAAIEANCVPALAKLLKAVDGNDVLCVIGRVIMELSTESVGYVSKLLSDGIMPAILKMAKLEIPTIKYDIARAMYNMTIITEPLYTMKVLKWDSIDILFWLTLHDCLDLYDPIKQHCVRALRNFTLHKNEALLLCNEDRLVTIMKALIKTTHLDVLSQIAAFIYNLLAIDECKAIMLKRGVIDLVFDVARCGVESVRHICSACLHMCPDDMPDMENPEVLSLVMCLLEADGDMFGEMGLRAVEQLEYLLGSTSIGTGFSHEGTDFSGHWVTLVCEVDAVFSPGSVPLETTGQAMVHSKVMAASSMGVMTHKIIPASEFHDFAEGPRPNSKARVVESWTDQEITEFGERDIEETGMGLSEDGFEKFDELTVNTPDPRPPSQMNIRNDADMNKSITSSKYNEAFDDTSTIAGDTSTIVDREGRGDFYTTTRPVQPEDIAFPKLYTKSLPDDTLGAIKGSLYKKKKPGGGSNSRRL